jgi:solute carrier family 25 protein 34/35
VERSFASRSQKKKKVEMGHVDAGEGGGSATSPVKRPPRTGLVAFAIPAAATSCACFFSNPFETIKTRLQLQGELVQKGAGAPAYRGIGDAFTKILRSEGFSGLQSGLLPGIFYQVAMNGTRLSIFPRLQALMAPSSGESESEGAFFVRNIVAGAVAGACGAVVGSPFFLIKARLQSQAAANIRSEGKEVFHYTGMLDGLSSVFKDEGIRGLWRGVDAAVPRVMVGSAAQLASYSSCKNLVHGIGFPQDSFLTYVASSFVSGLVVATFMNPFDVCSTRMYAQSRHSLSYSSPLDCFRKTVMSEGVMGLFKGWKVCRPLDLRQRSACALSATDHPKSHARRLTGSELGPILHLHFFSWSTSQNWQIKLAFSHHPASYDVATAIPPLQGM